MKRSEMLQSLVILPALAGAMTSIAQAADNKKQYAYQATPKGKDQCSGCSLFVPGKSATAMGTCKVVTGPISPKGWCKLYSAKS